jgi:outer membrane protein W
VPFLAELGGKITPNILIGGYLGLAVGGYGSALEATCKPSSVTCVTASLRIGAQIQYHILPAEKLNPWVGYGIGLESSGVSAKAPNAEASVAAVGIDFAHFTAGFDYRLNKQVGIGPVVDFSVGQYSSVVQKLNG